jgi:hypothetical protein
VDAAIWDAEREVVTLMIPAHVPQGVPLDFLVNRHVVLPLEALVRNEKGKTLHPEPYTQNPEP